jgi:cell wall-associated NlpC family hydrolase
MRLFPILFAACLSLQACAQLPFQTASVPEAPERSALLLDAMGYIGTPYVRGGTTGATGLDCSGFVKAVYEQSEGITLPRTAHEQAHSTLEIDHADLKPGDLVFFNTLRRAFSHVGIYVGEGRFIHSPRSGSQVRIESMNSSYWRTRFNGARRVPPVPEANISDVSSKP